MNYKSTILPFIVATLLAACSNSSEMIEKANMRMKVQLASDITVDVDRSSERFFPVHQKAENGSDDIFDYVCGRAIIDQPGLRNHSDERFMVYVRNGEPGFTRFDGSNEESTKKEFDDAWAENCPGYTLPRHAEPPSGAESTPAKPDASKT